MRGSRSVSIILIRPGRFRLISSKSNLKIITTVPRLDYFCIEQLNRLNRSWPIFVQTRGNDNRQTTAQVYSLKIAMKCSILKKMIEGCTKHASCDLIKNFFFKVTLYQMHRFYTCSDVSLRRCWALFRWFWSGKEAWLKPFSRKRRSKSR